MTEKRANEVFGGTFLIGLAVLFLINWWPIVLILIGVYLLFGNRRGGGGAGNGKSKNDLV